MGEVSLELIFELLKDMQRRMQILETKMDATQRVVIDLQREVVDVKSDVRLLHSDNLAFRGYLDSLNRDNYRNVMMVDR